MLGGTWAYGGDSAGYWWGQLSFAAGPKVELLTPTGGPDAAFLERFLAAHGAGPHHFNFATDDIEDTLARIRALGIEPVGVSLGDPGYREAFLHPRSAHGIVIQIAQQAGSPRRPAPQELPEPGRGHPVRADRAPRQRPGGRDTAVPGGPGRPAGGGRRARRRADLARWPPDQAGPRGRPAPRRGAAPRPLRPRRRHLHRQRPGARAAAGQAPRADGRAGGLTAAREHDQADTKSRLSIPGLTESGHIGPPVTPDS